MFRQRDIFKETIAADRLEFENARTLWAYDRKASEGKLADQIEQYSTAMREVNELRQSKTELETLLAQERKVWEEEKARGAQELRVAKGEIVNCHKKAQDMEAERIKWEKDRDTWESENVHMSKKVAEAMDELLKVDDGLPAFWTQLLETLEEQQTEKEPGEAQNCLDGASRVTSSLLAQVQLLAISLRKVKEGALAKANESKAEIAKLQRKAAKFEEDRAKDREQWEQERERSAEQTSVAKKLLRKAEKDKGKQHTPPETQTSSSCASKAASSNKTPEEEICELKQTVKAKREPNKSLTTKNTKLAEKAQRSSSHSAAASTSSSVDKVKKLTAKVKKSEEDVRKVTAKEEKQARIADMEKMLAAYPPSQAKGSAPSVSKHIYLSDSDSVEIISRPGTPLRSSKAGKNRKSNK
ncbi:hypothetical protein BDN70DRAFT_527970 [Pholiota conissans]|uniref:Uncharacterized protein n=1 Tax=Pholiota conissans TaxID=109636 RepID=A0A9P5Z4U7_9AGAR|nr:hypothetical protein BDN70DRAFT_527970 [Pholiota conissans]